MTSTRNRFALRSLAVVVVALLLVASAGLAPLAVAASDGPPEPPHRVYGDVTDANGDAVADTTVRMVDDETGDRLVETTTNSDGYYDVNVEQPDGDTFTIEVVDATDASETIEWSSGSSDQVDFQADVDDEDETTTTPPDDDDGDGAQAGGGGGGGQPADDDDGDAVDEPASKAVALAGTNPTVRMDAGEALTMIGFGSSVELTDTVSITELMELPAPAPQGATFVTGAEITFSSTNGENVDTVQMGAEQDTLDDLGVSADQLALYHLNEDTGEWEALETEVADEDNFEVVLEAPSAGFSTYAVFAQEDEDVTTTTAAPTTTEAPTTTAAPTTTEAPPTTPEEPGDEGPGALLIGGLAVIVLALIGALYLAFGRE